MNEPLSKQLRDAAEGAVENPVTVTFKAIGRGKNRSDAGYHTQLWALFTQNLPEIVAALEAQEESR